MKARGNKIGSITDLKTSCLAAGRPDFAYELVKQLQNALDSLKHKVDINEAVISEIRKEVSPAPWLRYKRERMVSDMPLHLEVADTDKVGRVYNVLRKEMGDPLTERMAIEDFRGLFSGAAVTKDMFEECQLVNSIFADVATQITEREEQLRLEYNNAQALWEAVRTVKTKTNESLPWWRETKRNRHSGSMSKSPRISSVPWPCSCTIGRKAKRTTDVRGHRR
jgi:hypothetical protein